MQRLFNAFRNPHMTRSNEPLSDEAIRKVAPSIFAEAQHESRSERYAYIPTSAVLQRLRTEGFQPFMACQTRVRDEGKRDHTRHMLRLRHPSQAVGDEASEIILLNSHDGTSSYQMVAGQFRFICANGLVAGEVSNDVRVPHKGDVADRVIEGAFEVLDGLTRVVEERESMKALTLNDGEQAAFARAALVLRYGEPEIEAPAPITERDVLGARRMDDRGSDLWRTFNRVQENLTRGGLTGRGANGKRITTRGVTGLDQNVKLNRALWTLAEEMRKLRAS